MPAPAGLAPQPLDEVRGARRTVRCYSLAHGQPHHLPKPVVARLPLSRPPQPCPPQRKPALLSPPRTRRPSRQRWTGKTSIATVANPIFFEGPVARRTESRPVFASAASILASSPATAEPELYALQIRYAIDERFGVRRRAMASSTSTSRTARACTAGWIWPLVASVRLIDDEANNFILTGGLTFRHPHRVTKKCSQGRGDGEWNPFISAEKGWGDFHLTGNFDVRIPNDSDAQSTVMHYSVMADYYVCRYSVPAVVANGWTVLSSGNNLPIDSEGYDVINFRCFAQGQRRDAADARRRLPLPFDQECGPRRGV